MSASILTTADAGASDTPPPGMKLLTMADFAHWPPERRPVRIDPVPHRLSLAQQEAWRRVVAMIANKMAQMALEDRSARKALAERQITDARDALASLTASKRHKGRAAGIRAAQRTLADLENAYAHGEYPAIPEETHP